MRRIYRWLGLAICLSIIAAFLYSLRGAVIWTRGDLRQCAELMSGSVAFGWRPDDWLPENEKYPPQPGWSVSGIGRSGPPVVWWILSGRSRAWRSVTIPLWMPLVLFAMPTGALWFRDRRIVAGRVRAFKWRIRPRHRKRITLKLVALFTVFHLALVIVGVEIIERLYYFYFPFDPARPRRFADLLWLVFPALFWGAPICAALWAWLYVRFANHLVRTIPTTACDACGYDLSGSVSGQCPECGEAIDIDRLSAARAFDAHNQHREKPDIAP